MSTTPGLAPSSLRASPAHQTPPPLLWLTCLLPFAPWVPVVPGGDSPRCDSFEGIQHLTAFLQLPGGCYGPSTEVASPERAEPPVTSLSPREDALGKAGAASSPGGEERSLPLKQPFCRGQTRSCFAGATHHEPDVRSGGGEVSEHRMGVCASCCPMYVTDEHVCGHRAMGMPEIWRHCGGSHGGAQSAAAVQGKVPWSGGLAGTGLLLSARTKVPKFSPPERPETCQQCYCQSL